MRACKHEPKRQNASPTGQCNQSRYCDASNRIPRLDCRGRQSRNAIGVASSSSLLFGCCFETKRKFRSHLQRQCHTQDGKNSETHRKCLSSTHTHTHARARTDSSSCLTYPRSRKRPVRRGGAGGVRACVRACVCERWPRGGRVAHSLEIECARLGASKAPILVKRRRLRPALHFAQTSDDAAGAVLRRPWRARARARRHVVSRCAHKDKQPFPCCSE